MGKTKKAKKLRRPNIPLAAAPIAQHPSGTTAVGGGLEMSRDIPASRSESAQVTFDYTHIRKDLARIGVLAGSFIAILVVLSFVLPLIIK
jgi:hypothetical protein